MSEENENVNQEIEETPVAEEPTSTVIVRRRYFTRRNFFVSFAALGLLVLLLGLTSYFVFRFGYFDNYVKTQFIKKMDEMGITFEAEVFRTTLTPMTLELKNATFVDKLTGEKLFRIDSAILGLTSSDLYSWQLSRTFEVESTDIDGAEIWIKFDENGKSNFSNINLTTEEDSRVKFKYSSTKFSLKNSLIHFGDVERKLSAEGKNVLLSLEPEDYTVPDDKKRFKFDFTSTESTAVYNEKVIEPIDLHIKGVGNGEGADITEMNIKSPLGEAALNGTISDWELPKYTLTIDSTIDLMQAANVLPNGTVLRGFGSFSGTVSGEGEAYKVEGEIKSDSLAASNVRLKALQINGTIEGEDSIYNANGRAIAEMLTFEDFKIDFPQIIGNVRGNGTDFRWVGELRAISARTPSGTLAGLFISDAVAEYEDKRFNANFGNVMARRFFSPEVVMENLKARNVRLSDFGGSTDVNIPNLQANVVKVKGAEMRGVNASDIKVRDRGSKTDVDVGALRAQNLRTKDAQLRNLSARGVNLSTRNGATDVRAKNVQAAQVDASGAKIGDLNATNVDARIRGNETQIAASNVKVSRVETDAAVLGSLNVAGVRLSIREGRIEGTSGDINAGDVRLTNATVPGGGTLQNVVARKPVFVLEPSGRYRASLDMSLGGGVLGSVKLGSARANVVAVNDQIALNNLNADVMDGKINGDAVIATNNRNRSSVDANFANLNLAKLLALQGGRVVPIAGQTNGKVNLTFPGTNIRAASGTLTAEFNANAGTAERGLIPVAGNLGLRATNGLFDIDYANLNTEKSALNATGRFDLSGYESNLLIALNSTDAEEIERLVKVLNLSPELIEQLNSNQAQFAGNLKFDGNLTGSLENPTIAGRATVETVRMRGRGLGSIATNIFVSPVGVELRDGVLQESDGGNVAFNVNIPRVGTNNTSVQATFNKVNTGNLLAALAIGDYLPEAMRDFQGETSGSINLSGLPKEINGEVNLSSANGTVAGQNFDGFDARMTIQNSLVNIEKFEARFADGYLRATGNYHTVTTAFNLDVEGKGLQVAKLISLFTKSSTEFPAINGTVNLTAKATGVGDNSETYDINFSGTGQNVTINENAFGNVSFVGNTVNQQLNANLTATLNGNQQQVITANVNFADPNLPLRAETNFNQTDLAPFIALVGPPESVAVTGKATGRVFLEGNLSVVGADGKRRFTTENLRGEGRFSELSLLFNETPFVANDPLSIRFNSDAVIVDNATFTGGGSNVVVNGTKALSANAVNNLTIEGKVNLRVLDVISKNTFFTGLADVSVRLTGVNTDSRLGGSATVQNATVSTFVGSERLIFNRINGRVIFNSDQAQIERATGYLGGGKIVASGGALIKGLQLQRFRIDISGQSVTAPLPEGFLTTGDAEIEVSGERVGDSYNTLIAGNITAKRALYTKDIDLADVIGNRRERTISEGSSSSFLGVPRLNLTIEGRDALVVRNNIADLTASASLRVTGDVDEPIYAGRITANSGTVLFRNDRYEVRRGVLEFPPQNNGAPFINLQAESEIQGYQIVVDLLGDLSNPEALSAVVRSNPALPQADVISLITTGSLANTDTGIPTLAQTGINTAAEIITDTLINNPVRKATDKLFGLNRFEIDPIISGRRLNPTARLTVGRQINRNLLITYSTNLSEDQNQVLALEYRVSNRLSFVAQYEQRSLSNVTRNSNNFSFEIRFRKRF